METLERDRDVITQTNRQMADYVTANRASIARTRVLIERISHLLSGGARHSYLQE